MNNDIIGYMFSGNRLLDYILFLLLFFCGLFAIKIVKSVILNRLKKWAEKTSTTLDDFLIGLIQSILIPITYFGVFYLSINTLKLSPLLKKIIDISGLTLITFFVARLAAIAIIHGLTTYFSRRDKDTPLDRSLNTIFTFVRIIVWGLAIIFLLDNLGFEISTVIAGLGIGGIAVAMAAQAVLKDLFSFFSILFDRPFEIGDFVIVDDYLGVVEHIGIKTTRIRSLGGEQLVFSNTDLTDSRLRNYKRMDKRRVLFRIGVTYQTALEQLREIPKIIEDIIGEINETIFDRAHFFSYEDSSLLFEIVYYVIGSDYNKYMDLQQEINFAINEEFQKRGIEFAYPTQTIYVR
ncbi:MAG: mechanosensitive ion channel family protein [Nitrospirota bacterium]